jgi:Domain of unknown function (DUF4436)
MCGRGVFKRWRLRRRFRSERLGDGAAAAGWESLLAGSICCAKRLPAPHPPVGLSVGRLINLIWRSSQKGKVDVGIGSGQRIPPKVRGHRWWPHMSFGLLALVAAVASAMITSVVLYVDGAALHRIPTKGPPTSGGTTVTLDVESIEKNYSELRGNLIVSPGAELLDPVTNGLKQDLSVAVTSTTTPVKRTWSKGMLPGVFPVPLTLGRDIERWPFDRYYTGPITVELFTGAAQVPARANVTFVDRLPGWKVHVTRANNANALAPYKIELQRSASTMVFAIVILCILVAIATVAMFVAVQTLRGLRRFQSPMTTWYAAMLFAVVPLRNALPGSPAFGSWIDLTIVLWVLVALVIAMLLYMAAWWRQLRPEPHGAATEEEWEQGESTPG